MKVLSTAGLTKLIQLIKSAFISVDDTVTTTTIELADVATTGDYEDLINTPNYGANLSYSNSQLQLKDQNGNNLGNPVTISGGGGGTWGSITGTLSNQTDLQNALDDKISKSGDNIADSYFAMENSSMEFYNDDYTASLSYSGLELTNKTGYSFDTYVNSDGFVRNINDNSTEMNFTLNNSFDLQVYDYDTIPNATIEQYFNINSQSAEYHYSLPGNRQLMINPWYDSTNDKLIFSAYLTDVNDNEAYIKWDTSDINTLHIPTPTQNYSLVANDAAITAGWLKTNAMPLKQDTLVSGTNIKTINNQSILGSGNITISGGGGAWGSITGTLSDQTDLQDALDEKVEYAMVIVDYTGD